MKRILIILVVALTANPVLAENEASPWAHSSQLGIALSGGNSDSQTYNVKQETSYWWAKNVLKSSGHYLVRRSNGAESANNWDFTLRYEENSPNASPLRGTWRGGRSFSGYTVRYNAGLGAVWIITGDKKNDFLVSGTWLSIPESAECRGDQPGFLQLTLHPLVSRGRKSLSEMVTFKMYIEALPDLVQSQNLLLNFEPSFNVALNSHFSLKLAYTGKFDGLPNTGKSPTTGSTPRRWWRLTSLLRERLSSPNAAARKACQDPGLYYYPPKVREND
ncbi:MAG: DUF481 domain-containing protein [Bdellovibrionota bacterium]